jgi:hypothetical protein
MDGMGGIQRRRLMDGHLQSELTIASSDIKSEHL